MRRMRSANSQDGRPPPGRSARSKWRALFAAAFLDGVSSASYSTVARGTAMTRNRPRFVRRRRKEILLLASPLSSALFAYTCRGNVLHATCNAAAIGIARVSKYLLCTEISNRSAAIIRSVPDAVAVARSISRQARGQMDFLSRSAFSARPVRLREYHLHHWSRYIYIYNAVAF